MESSHRNAISALAEHLRPVLEHSPDGVYAWLDERNKICNERLARMFGYDVDGWLAIDDFAHTLIDEESRALYVRNYQHHVLGLRYPVTFRFRGTRKDGSTFEAETDMIPLAYDGHRSPTTSCEPSGTSRPAERGARVRAAYRSPPRTSRAWRSRASRRLRETSPTERSPRVRSMSPRATSVARRRFIVIASG